MAGDGIGATPVGSRPGQASSRRGARNTIDIAP
jgi:hypothetical protein